MAPAPPAHAADRPAAIRVGNLAHKGELARFERRVWQGCGHEARIQVRRLPSDKRPGHVVDQYPPRGTRVGCSDTSAILYVSAGPPQAQLYVPALLEPDQRRAFVRQLRKACDAEDALVEVRRPYPLPPGRFVDQYPAQGERYRCGTPVEVVLSAGPRGESLATRDARPGPRDPARPPARRNPPVATALPAASPAPQPQAAAPRNAPALPPSTQVLAAAAARDGPATEPVPAPQAAPPPPPPPPAMAVETIPPADIPVAPERAPRPGLLVPSLLLLMLAALLVLLMLRRLAPPARARPAAALPDRTVAPPVPAAPIAPLITVERGWPQAEARVLPAPPRQRTGPPADALPDVPLLRDFLRPLDPALDWIAATPLDALAGAPAGQSLTAETLAPLRAEFADALAFALLFELPPLLADAWAAAPDLPFLGHGPSRGWVGLAPHVVEVRVVPRLRLRAAGVPFAQPPLQLVFRFTFARARLFLRGSALDAFEPGDVQVAADLGWAGEARPIAVLRPHAEWPGSLPVTPPRQIHTPVQAMPAPRRAAAG